MAKVEFQTFREAAEFTKSLALTAKITATVHKDSNCWWVDDHRDVQADKGISSDAISPPIQPQSLQYIEDDAVFNRYNDDTELNMDRYYGNDEYTQCNERDCDKDGNDGYNINGFDSSGKHEGTGTEFDHNGINMAGFDKDGNYHGIDGYFEDNYCGEDNFNVNHIDNDGHYWEDADYWDDDDYLV